MSLEKDIRTESGKKIGRYMEKIAFYKSGREAFKRNQPPWHLDLGLLALEI